MQGLHFFTRLLATAAVLASLVACGGGGGGGGGGATTGTGSPGASAPTIVSFTSASSSIVQGGSTTLTAVFSAGTGSISNGVGAVSSGVPVSVSPTSTTTYVLTVSGTGGATVTALTTVTVTASTAPISPVTLAFGTAALPYSGTVGINSSGYYQITGLTPGHRYNVPVRSSYGTVTYYSDAYATQIKCDPNVSLSCMLTPAGNAIWIRIYNPFMVQSSAVTIDAQHLSSPSAFEGAWDAPLVLNNAAGGLPYVGKVDAYNSYYSIQGLTVGKQYTFWVQSMTNDVRLGVLDPLTNSWIGGKCAPDNTWLNGATIAENCTWLATDTKFQIGIANSSGLAGSGYVLRVEEAVASEGSVAAPVLLAYAGGKAVVTGGVAAGGVSFYHVSGLTAGTRYVLGITGLARSIQPGVYDPPTFQSYDADATFATASACAAQVTVLNTFQCTVTASSTNLYFKVVGPASFAGVRYQLAVTPVAIPQGNPTPVAITAAQLPYQGQVSQLLAGGYNYTDSNYIVSGLAPNTYYQVFLKNLTGQTSLQAWDSSSSVINCANTSDVTATCALNSGPSGVIKVRVGASSNVYGQYANSFFTLDAIPAPQLVAATTYRDTSGPIAIPDPGPSNLPVTPVSVPINVSGSAVTSISDVTVELFISHGYVSQLMIELVAPNGTKVTLAAPNALIAGSTIGLGVFNLQLNDYASVQADGASMNLPYSNLPYYGSYRPSTPLHVLRGLNANGTWTLRVTDNQYTNIQGQTGEYRAWGISFK